MNNTRRSSYQMKTQPTEDQLEVAREAIIAYLAEAKQPKRKGMAKAVKTALYWDQYVSWLFRLDLHNNL
jgi:hypothetical protein